MSVTNNASSYIMFYRSGPCGFVVICGVLFIYKYIDALKIFNLKKTFKYSRCKNTQCIALKFGFKHVEYFLLFKQYKFIGIDFIRL